MRYICIQCGAGGASAHKDPHPPHDYNCHECPGEHTMWPAEHAASYRSVAEAYIRANTLAYSRPLIVYLADGTEHKVPYSDELMSFTHGEMQIRNPMLSECGRFKVDPRIYGFESYETGGCNAALYKELEGGRYMLLTSGCGLELPAAAEGDLLGLYTAGCDPLALIRIGDIPWKP